jgi:hypothetical protein
MDDLPKVGEFVRFDDPWFYPGTGHVKQVQFKPHHAVLVLIESIEVNDNQRWVGKETWILPGHLTVL